MLWGNQSPLGPRPLLHPPLPPRPLPFISISKYWWRQKSRIWVEMSAASPWERLSECDQAVGSVWNNTLAWPPPSLFTSVYTLHCAHWCHIQNPEEWQEVGFSFQKALWSSNLDGRMLCGKSSAKILYLFQTYCKVVTVYPKSQNILIYVGLHQ